MSETDVNREDQGQEEKKVTFSEEKENENKEDEEIDEEGTKVRTKDKVTKKEDTKYDTNPESDCDKSDDEDDKTRSTVVKQTDETKTNNQQRKVSSSSTNNQQRKVSDSSTNNQQRKVSSSSNSKDSGTHIKKEEENTPRFETDDEKEARRQSETNEYSNESQKQVNPSGYSLNSRSAAKTSQSESGPSEDKQETSTPRFITDDEKMAQTKPAENAPTSGTESNAAGKNEQSENIKQHKTESNDNKIQDVNTEEKSKDEKKEKSQPPKIQIIEKPKPKPRSEQNPDQQKQQTEKQKSSTNTTNRERPWTQQNRTPASSAKGKDSPKDPEWTNSPRKMAERETMERRRKAQSARLSRDRQESTPRDQSARGSSRASSRYYYRPPSRPRTCGYLSEERRRKEKEFFYAELNRLKDSLKKESKKIKKPKVRDHYPDVFTSLEPYYNTYTADYLINMPDVGYKENQPENAKEPVVEEDKQDLKFQTRCTAIGLTDPWDSLNMDRSVLPKLETSEMRKKRMDQISTDPKRKSGSQKQSRPTTSPTPGKKRPEAKQGSTRLPKFPVIHPPNADLTTKEFDYGDVPMLRGEMAKTFGHNGDTKKKSDYTRTKQDFYRMELDRLDEYHRISRPHMRAAYFAYLQNTPGSKQAVYDCLKEVTTKKEEKPMTPQAVA